MIDLETIMRSVVYVEIYRECCSLDEDVDDFRFELGVEYCGSGIRPDLFTQAELLKQKKIGRVPDESAKIK